ncbi:hypothetical protein BBF96_03865 [Anoxybacter fermentans]|uniref:Uncharacterized protein n=2 Tax=Anoxybacter fermentans TaxID=1323375 RepID=A0A3S9T2Q5_9FIRM|nr:hypothetical protein BBF96_03865 [Anoxybacter fermentans]
MAIKINNRNIDAPKFQELITKHGCIIKTRLGIHEVDNCAKEGLIILQLCGKDEDIQALGEEINSLDTVKAKWMKLDF